LRFEVKPESASPGEQVQFRDGAFVLNGRFRIEFQSPKAGHLYLLSESAKSPQGMTILFPSGLASGGSSYVSAAMLVTAPRESWYSPDPGRQRLWLVWSDYAVEELENAEQWANDADKGAIRDRASRTDIRTLLSSLPRSRFIPSDGTIRAEGGRAALSIDFETR
jgi:hypothetical protein